MRITLFISCLGGGGAERVTCNLANYLCKNNHDVCIITMSNKNDSYEIDNNVQRVNLLNESERKSKLHNLLLEWKRFKKYVISNQNIDCYVAMLPINSFMMTKLRKLASGKIIVSERGNPGSYSFIKRILMKYSAERCDYLVVQTEEIRKQYEAIKNITIIPNAINKDIVLPKHRKIEKKIVAVGRLTKQKNYPMAIEAFRLFSVKHPDYILEIYGQGVLESDLKQMVDRYDLTKKVKFMGYENNISEKISSAACFIMASDYEGISNALIEAMCIGLPCVVTDCDGGGARELIKNGENGILVDKGAIEDMAAGMCRIVEDEKFARDISDAAEKKKEELDGGRIYKKWQDLIEKVGK